ncbi:MAG: alkaline phytoceramidase [Cyanobacteria bacterium SZAS LIN-3]|nr:alkaline phytoceramidase [Cyanobacteria bacterium SZAS LIN-3]
MDSIKREKAVLAMLGFFVVILSLVLLVPPISQSLAYHDFADSRSLCGVSNFGNVVSNGAILLGGLAGLCFMFGRKARQTAETFATAAEWWPYLFVFIGATSIAIGSAYYHYQPGNERLIWDRLPMAVMFMALFGAIITERVSLAAAKIFTPALILLGVASVVGWALSEYRGAGDLRFYAIVQFFPMVATPLILWLFPTRYTRQADLIGSMLWYVLAKVFEMFDLQVYIATSGLVSGHTIKHVLCGVSIYWLVRMLQNRRPV